jgi:arginine decarboxylase
MSQDVIQRHRDIYSIAQWAEGYFDVDERGRVVVFPTRNPADGRVDLFKLASECGKQNLNLPVLFRFGDILRDRVDTLCNAFERAKASYDYQAGYTAVFPIKVNQQRAVVEDILKFGEGRVGLEAVSKPELMAVLALAPAGSRIVCNGYKDREYLRLALIGQQLGHTVYVVVEKLSEVDALLREAREMGVRPTIGVRVRLATMGTSKWEHTGGEKSKFGLSAAQILELVDKLKAEDMIDCLELLHFHLGSQIGNLRDIQRGMKEAGRCFAELHAMQVPVKVMDVGGGLGVDYEGSRTRSASSTNYTVDQYANAIVRALSEICAECDLPHPHIITESGRAMTAHHAVLVTNVIDVESIPELIPERPHPDDNVVLHDLWEAYENLEGDPPLEMYQDAVYFHGEAQQLYVAGVLTLEQRAHAERMYHATCRRVRSLLKPDSRAHAETLADLNEKLADKYFINLSVFQSVPDAWAIDQIFPIMPIHRLDEPAHRRAMLQDLTCDSDGRIDWYVDEEDLEPTLLVHPIRKGEEYLLAFFMVGAYQEILGDLHNLFGDTDSVNVELDDGPDGYRVVRPEQGDTVEDVLRYVHYSPDDLITAYRKKIAAAGIDEAARGKYLRELEDGFKGYTYHEK